MFLRKDLSVTVCIATYNRKKLLKKAVTSVLAQDYNNFEIIIVDDHSVDNTEILVKDELLKLDKRIKYIRHEENKGLAAARNTAIFAAKGIYFTFIDDDDLWNSNFLSTFIGLVKQYNANYIFCASRIAKGEIKSMEGKLKDFLILGYTPPVASQFYKTDELKKIGGYNESIKSGVDHDLWITLGANNLKILWLNKNLVQINQEKSHLRMTYNIDKRLNGVAASLDTWSEKYLKNFDKSFFDCLTLNYRYNTYKKFSIWALKNKEFLTFIKYIFKLPVRLLIMDMRRYIKTKCIKNITLWHPTFFTCIKRQKKNKLINNIVLRYFYDN